MAKAPSTAVVPAEEAAPPARKPSKAELAKHERVIDQGLKSFTDIGEALTAIHAGQLYKAAGFERFEDYCAQRWGFSRIRGHQLMEAASTVKLLTAGADAPVPNERIARELAPLAKADPEKAARLWQNANTDGGKVTAGSIRESVSQLLGRSNGHAGSGIRGTAAPRVRSGDGTLWTKIRDFAATEWLTHSPADVAAQVPDGDRVQVEGLISEAREWLQAFENAMLHRPKGAPAEEADDSEFEREPVEAQ